MGINQGTDALARIHKHRLNGDGEHPALAAKGERVLESDGLVLACGATFFQPFGQLRTAEHERGITEMAAGEGTTGNIPYFEGSFVFPSNDVTPVENEHSGIQRLQN